MCAVRSGSSICSSTSASSNRQSLTLAAFSENSAKFVPWPSHVAPSGNGRPGQTSRVDWTGSGVLIGTGSGVLIAAGLRRGREGRRGGEVPGGGEGAAGPARPGDRRVGVHRVAAPPRRQLAPRAQQLRV